MAAANAAAIVGGLGNPMGAIAGGFLIAFSEVALTRLACAEIRS